MDNTTEVTNTGLGGTEVYFNYSSTQNACDQMSNIIKDMKEKIEQIRNIVNQKDSIWRGDAANRFWPEFAAEGKEYALTEMETMTTTSMPKAIEAVLGLIEQNKNGDSVLMSQEFTTAEANDNIQASEADVKAEGVDTEINNATHANDSVKANSVTTDATGVDTQIINDTHVEGNIGSSTASVSASGVDTDTINKVGVSGAFGTTNSVDTTVKTSSTAYDKIINSFAEKE